MLPGMQMKLFECADPPRPKYFSNEVLEMTLDKLLPTVATWLQDEQAVDDPAVRDDIRNAIEFDDDSYQIVNYLDDRGWQCDRSLIDVMDAVGRFRQASHDYQVEKWVLNNGIQPKSKVGDRVNFKSKGKMCTGEVIEVKESLAKYLIFCPELGHVPKGQIGVLGVCLSYEDTQHV
jgi:hypothetical protein